MDNLNLAWLDMTSPVASGELHTREFAVATNNGQVRIGLDDAGRRHLLVPAGNYHIEADKRSRGVLIVNQLLMVDRVETTFVDIVCVYTSLETVFTEFVSDALRRIAASPEHPIPAVTKCLMEWRRLLGRDTSAHSVWEVIGLRGELEILRTVALQNPGIIVSGWRGPTGGTFDFQNGELTIEVKATTAQQGNIIHVHGLQQLDPGTNQHLHIALVRLQENDLGESVGDVVRDLLELGVARELLMQKLEKAKFYPDAEEEWRGRYRVVEIEVWRVDDTFPGLRKSRIAERQLDGVIDVNYELDLSAGGPPIPQPEMMSLFQSIVGGS